MVAYDRLNCVWKWCINMMGNVSIMLFLQVFGAFHPEWSWSQGPGCSAKTAQWPEQTKPSGSGQSYNWYKQFGIVIISFMSWILIHRWSSIHCISCVCILVVVNASFLPGIHVCISQRHVVDWFLFSNSGHIHQVKDNLSKKPKELIPTVFPNTWG